MLKLSDGAEARFRLIDTDPWGSTITVHLYGAGRNGWFSVSRRSPEQTFNKGPTPLAKGKWRTFLNLIKRARFWDLPARWPDQVPNVIVQDGDSLDFAGRELNRFHQIQRFIWREPELDPLQGFCLQVAGIEYRYPAEPKQSGKEDPATSADAEQSKSPGSPPQCCEPD